MTLFLISCIKGRWSFICHADELTARVQRKYGAVEYEIVRQMEM